MSKKLIAALLCSAFVLSACTTGAESTPAPTTETTAAEDRRPSPVMSFACPLAGTPCPPVAEGGSYWILERNLPTGILGGSVVLSNTKTQERVTWTLGDTQRNEVLKHYDYICVRHVERGFSTATGGYLYTVRLFFSDAPGHFCNR